MWINPIDARKRGIANGDRIRIFNDRGSAYRSEGDAAHDAGRRRAGEGAWYNLDASRGSGGQHQIVLTTQRPSPLAKGKPVAYQPCSG
ncbi:hypothetical protein MJ579_10315 [Klebsiella pneumoniae]|nr:hypothetical protein MJ579_10315 [Klebsiella pneumoniae]